MEGNHHIDHNNQGNSDHSNRTDDQIIRPEDIELPENNSMDSYDIEEMTRKRCEYSVIIISIITFFVLSIILITSSTNLYKDKCDPDNRIHIKINSDLDVLTDYRFKRIKTSSDNHKEIEIKIENDINNTINNITNTNTKLDLYLCGGLITDKGEWTESEVRTFEMVTVIIISIILFIMIMCFVMSYCRDFVKRGIMEGTNIPNNV